MQKMASQDVRESVAAQSEASGSPYQLRDGTREDGNRWTTSDGSIVSTGVLASTQEKQSVRQHGDEQENRHPDEAEFHHGDA